jgi:hypothetical protein
MSQIEPVNDNLAGPPHERRRERRARVLLKGKIVYAHSLLSADCTIRDLSPGGARITVNPEAIAHAPYLIVVRDVVVHRSRTIWQTAQQAGMRFLGTFDLSAETPLHPRAIQRIWLELAPR